MLIRRLILIELDQRNNWINIIRSLRNIVIEQKIRRHEFSLP